MCIHTSGHPQAPIWGWGHCCADPYSGWTMWASWISLSDIAEQCICMKMKVWVERWLTVWWLRGKGKETKLLENDGEISSERAASTFASNVSSRSCTKERMRGHSWGAMSPTVEDCFAHSWIASINSLSFVRFFYWSCCQQGVLGVGAVYSSAENQERKNIV